MGSVYYPDTSINAEKIIITANDIIQSKKAGLINLIL